ncbi:hypothetical protein Anas_07937 [Armadillidium nasatum]|uniref:THAP9-like helix-turn-helix domain-containing protein n=1 Tax=Armadillidium nasatum TaxID=96803 RepID=A0A5N5SXU5_9CRUS|nr:hypothetical protein Anas_07937 [Armadillidium nasatum]
MSLKNNLKRKLDDILDDTDEDEALAPKIVKVSSFKENDPDEDTLDAHYDGHTNNTNDKQTMTEEDYVTDIEKAMKDYTDTYKELELEEYKQMLKKFYTQNLRLATRCQKLKAAVEKTQTTSSKILREISKQVNPHQLAFISAQIINSGKPGNRRVFSPQLKSVVVGLYQLSPVAYRYLSKILTLPEEDEVKQWVAQGNRRLPTG